MKNGQIRHLINIAIGCYLFFCGLWMLRTLILHTVELFFILPDMISKEYFSMITAELFPMMLSLFISDVILKIGLVISCIMCFTAFLKLKSGRFIVRAGTIWLIAYTIVCIIIFIFSRSLRNTRLLVTPLLLIACGVYWTRYLKNYAEKDGVSQGQKLPFVQQFRILFDKHIMSILKRNIGANILLESEDGIKLTYHNYNYFRDCRLFAIISFDALQNARVLEMMNEYHEWKHEALSQKIFSEYVELSGITTGKQFEYLRDYMTLADIYWTIKEPNGEGRNYIFILYDPNKQILIYIQWNP